MDPSTGDILMIDIVDSKYVLGLKHTKPIPRAKALQERRNMRLAIVGVL